MKKQALSHEDKNPPGLSWMQRNYLGIKKIEQGKAARNRDAIWKETPFEEVRQYLNEHGENSLPKTMTELIKKDPVLLAKMTAYNFITILLRGIRFWGFAFLLPILALFSANWSDRNKLPMLLFLVFRL